MKRLRERLNDDTGSISVWVLLTAGVLMLLIGLVVDSAGKYQADELAQQVAAGAARTAVNSIGGSTVLNGSIGLNEREATAVAEDYLAAAGVIGSVSINGQVVSVDVEIPYTTLFVSLIGINTLTGTGSASAQLITQ